MNNFCLKHNFKVENMFETNVFKLCFKMNFNNFKCFGFYNHQFKVKIFTNFEKEWCTFDNEKGHLKKTIVHNCLQHAKGFRVFRKNTFLIVQWNKITILSNIVQTMWFVLLWFYPKCIWVIYNKTWQTEKNWNEDF